MINFWRIAMKQFSSGIGKSGKRRRGKRSQINVTQGLESKALLAAITGAAVDANVDPTADPAAENPENETVNQEAVTEEVEDEEAENPEDEQVEDDTDDDDTDDDDSDDDDTDDDDADDDDADDDDANDDDADDDDADDDDANDDDADDDDSDDDDSDDDDSDDDDTDDDTDDDDTDDDDSDDDDTDDDDADDDDADDDDTDDDDSDDDDTDDDDADDDDTDDGTADDGTTDDAAAADQGASTAAVSSDDMASTAFDMDQQLNLRTTGNLFENWGGRGEKWLYGNGGWYFILPDGGLVEWDGTAGQATGTVVAQLSQEYHADPSMLFNAPEPEPVPATNLAGSTAAEIDSQLGLKQTLNDFFDWGGRSEKWLMGTGNQWYFILSNGELYRWDGSGTATGELISTLDAAYHSDLSLLTEASTQRASDALFANGDALLDQI